MPTIVSPSELAALVRFGATVRVTFPDGLSLAARPVDWLRLGDGELAFWWLGEDEHPHTVTGNTLIYDPDDGTLTLRGPDGGEATVEAIYNGADRLAFDLWCARLASGAVVRAYPEGGYRATV